MLFLPFQQLHPKVEKLEESHYLFVKRVICFGPYFPLFAQENDVMNVISKSRGGSTCLATTCSCHQCMHTENELK